MKTDDLRVHTLSTFCQNIRAWINVKTLVGWGKLTKTFFQNLGYFQKFMSNSHAYAPRRQLQHSFQKLCSLKC